jgi:hypothetical protein
MPPPVNSGKALLELAKQGLLLGRGEFSPELASGYLGLNLGPLRCLPPRPVEHAVSRPLADVLVLRREVLLKDAERQEGPDARPKSRGEGSGLEA